MKFQPLVPKVAPPKERPQHASARYEVSPGRFLFGHRTGRSFMDVKGRQFSLSDAKNAEKCVVA